MNRLVMLCVALVAVCGTIPLVGCSSSGGTPQDSGGGAGGRSTGGSGGQDASGDTSVVCETGSKECPCYGNQTCNAGLTCDNGRCVVNAGGSGGTGAEITDAGAGGEVGPGDAEPDASEGGPGGQDGSTDAAADAAGGTGGGQDGSADAAPDTTGGQDGSTDAAPDTTGGQDGSDARVLDDCGGAAKSVVENFFTCDQRICEIDGRSGSWYTYAKPGITNNLSVAANQAGFVNQSCAAAARGSYIGQGIDAPFAGIGFALADQAPYDVSQYTGVQVSIETTEKMYIHIYATDGADFIVDFNQLSNSNKVKIPFTAFRWSFGETTLDLTKIEGFKFTPDLTAAETMSDTFKFAVYSVQLYN